MKRLFTSSDYLQILEIWNLYPVVEVFCYFKIRNIYIIYVYTLFDYFFKKYFIFLYYNELDLSWIDLIIGQI